MKDNTLRERMIRCEDKIDSLIKTMDNHLDHHRKLLWILVTIIGAEVIRQLLPPVIHLVATFK